MIPEVLRKRVGRAISRLKEANNMAAKGRWDVTYTLLWKSCDELYALMTDIENHAPDGDMEERISNREQRRAEYRMRDMIVERLTAAGMIEAAQIAMDVPIAKKRENLARETKG